MYERGNSINVDILDADNGLSGNAATLGFPSNIDESANGARSRASTMMKPK